MKYRITISEKAYEDLNSIFSYLYVATFDEKIGIRVIKKIKEVIYSLDYMPERFRMYEFKNLKKRKIHVVRAYNYLIFYEIKESYGQVEILRILHSSRDMENI